MNRDEAIEAGARAIWGRSNYVNAPTFDEAATERWQLVEIIRADVAAVLDAIGWVETSSVLVPPETFEAMQDPTPDYVPNLRAAVERRIVAYLTEPNG